MTGVGSSPTSLRYSFWNSGSLNVFVIASWIARLKPAELPAAQAELKSAGFTNPTIRDFDDQPLDIKAIDKPIDVQMDVEPRSPDTLGLPGRAYDRHSVIGPMLAQAASNGKPVA